MKSREELQMEFYAGVAQDHMDLVAQRTSEENLSDARDAVLIAQRAAIRATELANRTAPTEALTMALEATQEAAAFALQISTTADEASTAKEQGFKLESAKTVAETALTFGTNPTEQSLEHKAETMTRILGALPPDAPEEWKREVAYHVITSMIPEQQRSSIMTHLTRAASELSSAARVATSTATAVGPAALLTVIAVAGLRMGARSTLRAIPLIGPALAVGSGATTVFNTGSFLKNVVFAKDEARERLTAQVAQAVSEIPVAPREVEAHTRRYATVRRANTSGLGLGAALSRATQSLKERLRPTKRGREDGDQQERGDERAQQPGRGGDGPARLL